MKLKRPILIATGIVAALGVIALGLALTPSVQRWAVLREAAKQPGLKLKLDSVSAGWSTLSLQGVQMEHQGVKVGLAQLQAEYSLWAALFSQRLQIGQLTVKGLQVDATRLSPQRTQAGMAAAPAAAPGALAQVKLPWELVLGDLDVQGRVLLAGAAGQPAMQGEFKLSGGQIGPGRDGAIQLKARVTNPDPAAPVTVLDARATLQVRESFQRTFDHINLTTLLDASGPGLTGENQLKLVALMSRDEKGESYQVKIDTLRAGQGQNLLTLNAALAPGAAQFTGDWTLAARSAQLESFLLGRAMPKFGANGAGRFTVSPATAAATLQGSLQVEAENFATLMPELSALGVVRLNSEFDMEAEANVVRLKKFELSLAGEQPVFELRAIGTPAFNLKQRQLEPSGVTSGEIMRLNISGLPLAWIAPFCAPAEISGGRLTGELSVTQGEGNQLKLQTSTPLQADGITVVHAGHVLLTKAELKLEAEAEISPSRASARIRSLRVKSAGGDVVQAKLTVNGPFGLRLPLAVEGEASADLPTLLTPWLPTGPVKARGAIDFTLQGERIEVRRLAAESTDEKGLLLASLTVTRAFAFDLAKGRAETGAANEVQLANLKLGQLPLITLPKLASDYTLSVRPGPTEATISALDGKLTLRATTPMPLFDLSVAQKKKLKFDRLKLLIQPIVEMTDGVLTMARSGDVTLRTGTGVPLAQFTAELIRKDSDLRVTSTFNLELPAWATQPALIGRDALSSGQASGEIRAAFSGGAAQIESRATLKDMIASVNGQTLPVANLSLRIDADAAGKFSVIAPVLLDRAGQRSDLRLAAEGLMAERGLVIDSKLTSEQIALPDLLVLLSVFGSSLGGEGADSAAAQGRALSPPAADQTAFWAGLTGQVALDCKTIINGEEWAMNGLTGRLVLDDKRVTLEKLDTVFDEKGRFAAKGTLTFSGGMNPYQLTGDFSLTDFAAGQFFKSFDPERTPTLEGLFNIKGQLEGQGLNFDDTIDRTRGSFDLSSRKGVFRGFRRSADKLTMAAKTVGLVSALLGDKSAEKIAGNAFYVEQLAQELGELNFDQFTVRLVRDQDLNLKLENITLLAQEIHFIGSGQIKHVAGQPLLTQPLEASLTLRSRGKTESILGKLSVLEGTRDELGYAKTKEMLTLGGTLSRPNATAFFTRLVSAKLNDLLAPEN